MLLCFRYVVNRMNTFLHLISSRLAQDYGVHERKIAGGLINFGLSGSSVPWHFGRS